MVPSGGLTTACRWRRVVVVREKGSPQKGKTMNTKTKKRVAHAAMVTERVIAVQERRRSGAAGGHDNRPKRLRTRATAKQAALREW